MQEEKFICVVFFWSLINGETESNYRNGKLSPGCSQTRRFPCLNIYHQEVIALHPNLKFMMITPRRKFRILASRQIIAH